MKVRDTSPGRLYALSSEIGCTAINGAMAVDIPAGGQVVVLALAKKIVIDGDDAAKFVEVRWGTNTVVGSRPAPAWLSDVLSGLISIVGDDNFDINYIPAENKLYLQFSLDVTTEQIEEVKSLLARVLPKDLVVEMEWADGLPMTYTRLEYLESTGTQWFQTDNFPQEYLEAEFDSQFTQINGNRQLFGMSSSSMYIGIEDDGRWYYVKKDSDLLRHIFRLSLERSSGKKSWFISDVGEVVNPNGSISTGRDLLLNPFSLEDGSFRCHLRCYGAKMHGDGALVCNLIPALDDTGTPCMFDAVSRTPFRNDGTGDFIIGIETQQQLDNMLNSFPNYTGQAIEKLQINLAEALQTPENEARLAEAMAQNSTMPAMLSLDGEFVAPKFYAQFTEHGVRRLYHVPKGYIGTMDEYAAVNGFKELIEPPMPFEGYWAPAWRETDTQLILDWVETEPPTEEETPIEEIENA